MHNIVKANSGIRTLAALIDFLIALFLTIGLFAGVQAIFMHSEHGKAVERDLIALQVESGLYAYEDETLKAYTEYGDYQKYEDMLVSYYLEFLPAHEEGCAYDAYWYNVHILGLEDYQNLYPNATIQSPAKENGSLWAYRTENEERIPGEIGVPNPSLYEEGHLSVASAEKLLNFYYNPDSISSYYQAAKDLSDRSFYVNLYDEYSRLSFLFPMMIAAPIALCIYYLAIPLFFKNGETLAKRFFRLCLVNSLGFTIRKSQLVLRALPTILLFSIMLFFLSFRYAVIGISILLFVSYMLSLFQKEHKALHDFIAGTMVINERESVFYDSLADQEAGEKAYEERMKEVEFRKAEGLRLLLEEERRKSIVIEDSSDKKTPGD